MSMDSVSCVFNLCLLCKHVTARGIVYAKLSVICNKYLVSSADLSVHVTLIVSSQRTPLEYQLCSRYVK